jgi:hypothetical protein
MWEEKSISSFVELIINTSSSLNRLVVPEITLEIAREVGRS